MCKLLMLGCLGCDGLHCILDVFGISKVIMADWMKQLIQFVHQGDSRGDIQIENTGIRNAIEILHKRTEAVAMTSDQDGLAGLHRQRDLIAPIRKEPRSCILQALCRREQLR